MIMYFVLALAFDCSSSKLGSWTPGFLSPVLCKQTIVMTPYDPARLREAKDRVTSLGSPTQLVSCTGTRCSGSLVTWNTPKFKEADR